MSDVQSWRMGGVDGMGEGCLAFEVELSPESEVLSGEEVFEWPRYL
jgi:hypothetical protein